MNPHTHKQLVYNKGSKIIQCGNDSLFNNWCKEKCRHMQKKKIKLNYSFTPCTKLTQNESSLKGKTPNPKIPISKLRSFVL